MSAVDEANLAAIAAALVNLEFLLESMVFALGIGLGMFTWQLVVYAKNNRSIW